MQSLGFGNALHLGPCVPCKRHCSGDHVNQHSPVHHPLGTQYDEPNFLGAEFHQTVIQIQIPHHKFPFLCKIICPIKFVSGMNHQNSISGWKKWVLKIFNFPTLKLLYLIRSPYGWLMALSNNLFDSPTVNQNLLVHHEGWMVSGQPTVFCWLPAP